MNAILLGAASFGALIAIFTSDTSDIANAKSSLQATKAAQVTDVGSMTRTVNIDPETGEKSEISVIAFVD